MRIIIDAMGGDNAPGEIIKGAVQAQKALGVDIILVGREEAITATLQDNGITLPHPHFTVQNATEVVEVCEDPSTVLRRKRDSSLAVSLRMLRDGDGDAMISAGSTGALLAGATLVVKRIHGIRRAALAPSIPVGSHGALLIDSGANVECTPEYLLQFAYMGSFYSQHILGCKQPRVGLLNVGAEDSKGTELHKQTHRLLTQAAQAGRIHFVGNIEAKELFKGGVEVLVADGFSGNIMLKTIEGTAGHLMRLIKTSLTSGGVGTKLGAVLVKGAMGEIKRTWDPNEVGGSPLLGIAKPVLKAHGSSDARAIYNAVVQAVRCVEQNLCGKIQDNVAYMCLEPEDDTTGA